MMATPPTSLKPFTLTRFCGVSPGAALRGRVRTNVLGTSGPLPLALVPVHVVAADRDVDRIRESERVDQPHVIAGFGGAVEGVLQHLPVPRRPPLRCPEQLIAGDRQASVAAADEGLGNLGGQPARNASAAAVEHPELVGVGQPVDTGLIRRDGVGRSGQRADLL